MIYVANLYARVKAFGPAVFTEWYAPHRIAVCSECDVFFTLWYYKKAEETPHCTECGESSLKTFIEPGDSCLGDLFDDFS